MSTTPGPKGHPLAFLFFFWGEFAERCSYYGMRAILALYMTERLGVDKGDAGTFMSLFIGACYFFPLIGGWIADNFLGKYWTIVLFSVPYVIAQFCVGIENKYMVCGALVLLAMGSGVIKPNISTLMGLTYDQQRPGQDQLRTSAFSWFYMAINIGAYLSQLTMPWLRTKYGYQVAFLFPAGLMSLALLIFGLGKRFYAKEVIERKIVDDNATEQIADTKSITGIPIKHKIYTRAEAEADKQLKIKVLSRIGLLFLTVMFFWAIFDQSASTWIFFANTYMDTTILGDRAVNGSIVLSGETLQGLIGTKSFSMSADAIQSFNPLFIILFVPVSVAIFKLVQVKATTKIAIGYVLTGLSMVIMSFAGSMAGKAEKALKITSPQGEIVVSNSSKKLDELAGASSAALDLSSTIRLTSNAAKYNPDNKKIELTEGVLQLKDGRPVTIAKGRFNKLDDVLRSESSGILETNYKAAAPDVKDTDLVTVEVIDWVKPEERVTVWWQIFAYLILTIAEILISVTGLELAFVAAPQTMKSFVTACWLAVVFLANILINAPITQLYPKMSPMVYFAMLGGAMVFVLVIFIPIASRFNKAMEEAKTERSE